MTILFYIIIYVVGYVASVILMHKYHKQLDMNYNVEKTYVNHDDWDNNAQAFAGISVAWFLFWSMTLFMYIAKNFVKFSANIEKSMNKPNEHQEQINELMKGNAVLSAKLESLKETMANELLNKTKLTNEIKSLRDSKLRREQWLNKAKRDSGFPVTTSFDDVWNEVLSFYKENKK